MWHVYILKCKNGQLYTGISDDVEQRFCDHAQGRGGHFTKKFGAVKLLYKKEFATKHEAALREQQIKRWTRVKKMMLIQGILK